MLLDRLMDLEKTPGARVYGEAEYDLQQYRVFLESLGLPQKGQQFLHVAGTKGKGSTAAIMEGLLRGLGFPTALYSSPHLEHFGERFRFDGKAWTAEEFEGALERFYERLGPEQRLGFDAPHPFRTVFETLTTLALVEFRARAERLGAEGKGKPQVVCWETGLGGRLDCSNVVDPVASVITVLAMDHMKVLGDSMEQIATEKAGIIKAGKPVIVARQAKEFADKVWPVLLERAASVGAPVVRAWEHNPVVNFEQRYEGQWVRLRRPDGREEEGVLPLQGRFQQENLEAAVAAVWYLLKANGINPEGVELLKGLSLVFWPGRFEVLRRKNGRMLILDGAHCAYSAKIMGREAAALIGMRERRGIVFSMQKDKDARAFLRGLFFGMTTGTPQDIYIYPLPGPRGANVAELANIAEAEGFVSHRYSSPADAFASAMSTSDVVMAVGTLYTLAEFKKLWLQVPEGEGDARA